MPVDLAPDPPVADLAKRTADFVRETVLPVEERHGGVLRDETVRRELQRSAQAAGVFAPHVSAEFGGHGLDMRGRAVVFEEAGYSLLGPLALNMRRARRGQHAPAGGGRDAPSSRSATCARWPPARCGRASR